MALPGPDVDPPAFVARARPNAVAAEAEHRQTEARRAQWAVVSWCAVLVALAVVALWVGVLDSGDWWLLAAVVVLVAAGWWWSTTWTERGGRYLDELSLGAPALRIDRRGVWAAQPSRTGWVRVPFAALASVSAEQDPDGAVLDLWFVSDGGRRAADAVGLDERPMRRAFGRRGSRHLRLSLRMVDAEPREVIEAVARFGGTDLLDVS